MTSDDARLRRLERIAAATFVSVHGDRGYGQMPRFPCPDCGGSGRSENEMYQCERCAGRGDIDLKSRATIDTWEIFRETDEAPLETRSR